MRRAGGTTVLAMVLVAATAIAAGVRFKVARRVPLDLKTTPPTFACLEKIALLDRGRLAYIGRPIEDRATFTVLDLENLEVRNLTVPDTPRVQVAAKGQVVVDKPLYYDTANGAAGILMRAGGVVSGDPSLLEWDLKANRALRTVPLAQVAPSQYLDVRMIGYDPGTRECFIEAMREKGPARSATGQGGRYELAVLAVRNGAVRTVATVNSTNRYTASSPYFDPVHRRSAHVEYVEIGGEQVETGVRIVDLDSGTLTGLRLPRVIYGFAFDPDGQTAYAYSNTTGEVLKVGLATGRVLKSVRYGRFGHGLGFVAPGTLVLMRNARFHFLDSGTLKEKWGIDTSEFHQGSPNASGSIAMPGRILARIYYDLYILDLPGYAR